MKILAITYSGQFSGGANRSLFMVLKNLKKIYGHEIYVLSPKEGNFTKALEEECIACQVISFFSNLNSPKIHSFSDILRYFYMFYKSFVLKQKAKQLATVLKKENFDVVYTTEMFNFFGLYLSQSMHIPHVWHFRSFSNTSNYMPGTKKTFKNMWGKFIVISNYLKAEVHRCYDIPLEKLVMISNGLEYGEVKEASQSRENGIHMLLCGRIVASKGHLDALKALYECKQRGMDQLYLHFAGSVPTYSKDKYYEKLKEYIETYHLADNVIFEGEIEDMMTFREDMNIELMCSVAEPFGRVTVEGMRSGLVVIASNTGGSLDIIQDGYNGLFYEQGNSKDLADKIEDIVRNPQKAGQLSLNAIEFAKTHFTMEKNVKEINEVLECCVYGK